MVLSKAQVRHILEGNLNGIPNLKKKLHVVDNAYEAISKTAILQMVKTDEWLQADKTYQPEVFDCDDFAMHLKVRLAKLAYHQQRPYPAALGFLLTTIHAFNFSIGKNKGLVLYDTVNKKVEDRPSYFMAFLNLNPGNIVKLLYL